jgi:hypothetical protein
MDHPYRWTRANRRLGHNRMAIRGELFPQAGGLMRVQVPSDDGVVWLIWTLWVVAIAVIGRYLFG